MLGFNPHVHHQAVEVAFAPRLSQVLDLVIVQLTSYERLQLQATDPLLAFVFLVGLEARFEARLHAQAERGVEGDGFCVAAHLGPARRGVFDGEELVANGLEGEGGRIVWDGNDYEGFLGRDGRRCCTEDAVLVAA